MADREVARDLAKEKDVAPGTDGARVETDRTICIYRESPGEPRRAYRRPVQDTALDYVVLADAIDS